MAYFECTPAEARQQHERAEVLLLDVRTLPEWLGGHVSGALHIPLDELTLRYQELDPDRRTLVICAHGIRSAAAAEWLARVGFAQVGNVRHGMAAWPGPVESGRGTPSDRTE